MPGLLFFEHDIHQVAATSSCPTTLSLSGKLSLLPRPARFSVSVAEGPEGVKLRLGAGFGCRLLGNWTAEGLRWQATWWHSIGGV